MSKFLARFLNDEAGATSIEYALMMTMIAVVIITAVTSLGVRVKAKFTATSAALGT